MEQLLQQFTSLLLEWKNTQSNCYDGCKMYVGKTLDTTTDTVALYNMNEAAENSCSGGEDLCDASGNNNHGTNYGATIGDGKTGNGWVFDGVTDYIQVDDDNTLDFGTGDFTIEYWLNMSSVSSGEDYFPITKTSAWDTTPGWAMETYGYAGSKFDINFFITNVDGYWLWSANDKNINTWYHVAVVRDGSDLHLYINGAEEANIWGDAGLISANLDNSEPLLIGKSSFAVNNFPGTIDELRILKEARSAYMIEQDYLNGAHVTDCKWDETDTAYSSMANTCTDTANCTLDLTGEEDKTVYMRCEDSNATVSSTSYQLDYTIGSPPPPPDPGITALLSNTMPNTSTNLTVTYDTDISVNATVTDGSLKLTLSDEFDLSHVTDSDISVTGGDVTWSSDYIIKNDDVIIGRNSSWLYKYLTVIARAAGETSIVFPFTGDYDAYDNTTEMVIGNLNQIINPLTPGTYDVLVQVYDNQDATGNLITESLAKVVILDGVNVSASVPNILQFTISGVTSGNTVNGSTTDTSSTSTAIDFGVFTAADNRIAAHDLAVSSNATDGFIVTQQVTGDLATTSDSIGNFTGTNASPAAWSSPPGSGTESYWGYTTEDTTLSTSVVDRFDGGLWAGFSTSPFEVFYHSDPTDSTVAGQGTTRIGYRIELTDLQEAGIYTTNIMYICTPTY